MKDKYSTDHPQVPGYFRWKVGAVEVTALCDGFCKFHPSICADYTSMTEAELAEMVRQDFTPMTEDGSAEVAMNAFLVNTGEKLILIDTGRGYVDGEIFLEKHGLVVQFLRDAGYESEDIDIVLLTHLHVDHICGVEEGGERVFSNATIYIAEPEKAFWLDTPAESMPEEARLTVQLAQTAVRPYLETGRVETFRPGEEIFSHIKSVALFGHTPGHTGYMVSSEGESLFIWGDMFHVKSILLTHPEVGIIFDSDAKAAADTRRKMLAKLAEQKQLVAGAHLPFPGMGYIDKEGSVYRFHPVEYRFYR